jgi:hypothetical protein
MYDLVNPVGKDIQKNIQYPTRNVQWRFVAAPCVPLGGKRFAANRLYRAAEGGTENSTEWPMSNSAFPNTGGRASLRAVFSALLHSTFNQQSAINNYRGIPVPQ